MTRISKSTPFRSLSLLAGAFCLAMAANVYAEETAKPCAEDAAKFCKGVEQGEGRIAKCMKEHESELSPACKQNIAKAKERVKEAAEACKGDAEKVCKDVKPGRGRIVRCLKQHEDSLSPACKEEMQNKGRKQK